MSKPNGAAVHTRGTSNKNCTGSAANRRARKQWLLDTFGNGFNVWCTHCPTLLDFATVTVDRIVPGALGGTYRRGNIQPCCGPCNVRLGNELKTRLGRARRGVLEICCA